MHSEVEGTAGSLGGACIHVACRGREQMAGGEVQTKKAQVKLSDSPCDATAVQGQSAVGVSPLRKQSLIRWTTDWKVSD